MRLLEFNRDEGGANPIPAKPHALPETAKPSLKKPETTATPSPARAATVKRSPKRTKPARQAKVFPLNSVTTPQARRKPIDLEQLQHRVGVLEKRIKARTEALGDEVAAKDLEKLKQRMQLLARSMVKIPQILILDEPCQGLDRINRQRILDAVEIIGYQSKTNIIYVTHYPHEIPTCMTHMLQFDKTQSGIYRPRSRRL